MSAESNEMSLPDFDAQTEREEIIEMLQELIEESHRKATEGRVHDAENERVRQDWFRECGYQAKVLRSYLEDRDLEDMQDQIEEIKASRGY